MRKFIKGMESRRQLQVGELIKRNFSMVLFEEGSYIYGSEIMVSVTQVYMSPDLGLAKIYLSIYNSNDKELVLSQLDDNHNKLKHNLTQRIRKLVRRIPDISFYIDDTLDEIDRVNELLEKTKPGKGRS